MALALGRISWVINNTEGADPESMAVIRGPNVRKAAILLAQIMDDGLDPLSVNNSHTLDWLLRGTKIGDISPELLRHVGEITPLAEGMDLYVALAKKARKDEIKPETLDVLEELLGRIAKAPITPQFQTRLAVETIIQGGMFQKNGKFLPALLEAVRARPEEEHLQVWLGAAASISNLRTSMRREIWELADEERKPKIWLDLFDALGLEDSDANFRVELARALISKAALRETLAPFGMRGDPFERVFEAVHQPGLVDNLDLYVDIFEMEGDGYVGGVFPEPILARIQNHNYMRDQTVLSAYLIKVTTRTVSSMEWSLIKDINGILKFMQQRKMEIHKRAIAAMLNSANKAIRVAAIGAAGKLGMTTGAPLGTPKRI